ncbi:MAG TPA: transketolase C-terminal domain-containing protein [Burkholderiaceae bacterium]|mgnify:CR=1 FL=1|nr:transketolase C-terminal domain-containing protein [Burkholderiaceae bacterium]
MTLPAQAMRDAFLLRLLEAMRQDDKLFFVTADFGSPVLDRIRAEHPNRFVNVGIAEQNLINVSAGLALEGFTVFAYAIAPFITMRCYEQIRVSLALLSEVRPMNVNLIGVGAGYSYVVSGPTHQCYEDLTIMRCLPNLGLLSPCDHVMAAAMFDTCIARRQPKYLRLDAQVLPIIHQEYTPNLGRGFASLRREGKLCFVATGYPVHTAIRVADEFAKAGRELAVIDLFDMAGFDKAAFLQELTSYQALVTLEEGFKGRGGLDAMLFDFLANEVPRPLLNLGVTPGYRFELGNRTELHEQVGIGPEAVKRAVSAFMDKHQL